MSQKKESAFDHFVKGIRLLRTEHEGHDYYSYIHRVIFIFLTALRFVENHDLYDEFYSSYQSDIHHDDAVRTTTVAMNVIQKHDKEIVK